MEKYKKLVKEINFFRKDKVYHRFVIKIGKYCFSIVTGSYYDSASLGAIEMAILKNGEFAFSEHNPDDSIINYMDFRDFKSFIEELENIEKEKLEGNVEGKILEELFLKYKKKSFDEFQL